MQWKRKWENEKNIKMNVEKMKIIDYVRNNSLVI